MALKIKEIEGDFGETIRAIIQDKELELIDDDGFSQIWRQPTYTYIPTLNIAIHSAISCIKNEDSKEYEQDSDLYIIYDNATREEAYFEFGSSLSVCIYNYCHAYGVEEWHDLEKIENLSCIYVLDHANFRPQKLIR